MTPEERAAEEKALAVRQAAAEAKIKELDRQLLINRLHLIKAYVIWYGVQALFVVLFIINAVIFVDPITASLIGHEKLLGLGQGWWWLAVANLIWMYHAYRYAAWIGAMGSIKAKGEPRSSESESEDDDDHR